jgi:hypothetical protein
MYSANECEHLSICVNLAKVLQQYCEKLCVARGGCEAAAKKLRESCDMHKITSRTCLSYVLFDSQQCRVCTGHYFHSQPIQQDAWLTKERSAERGVQNMEVQPPVLINEAALRSAGKIV